ncbi:fasciculation and elongation protein zeta-2-like [Saccoglossus kowalevskii]
MTTQSSPEEALSTEEDRWSLISQELLKLRERSVTTSSYEECKNAKGLKDLSLLTLNELLEELESTIQDYSEVLIEQLALRDELEFEKEVKNQFISNLITVQNKLKARYPKGKKGITKKKLKNGPDGGTVSTFFTFIIPYLSRGPEHGKLPKNRGGRMPGHHLQKNANSRNLTMRRTNCNRG